jgi:hypothetical protein
MAYQEMLEYWKEAGIKPVQQVVVCAANKMPDGLLLCGARHWDSVMRAQAKALCYNKGYMARAEQGFIDQFGTFLTREEAMVIVSQSGQPFNIERNGRDVHLFSEGYNNG